MGEEGLDDGAACVFRYTVLSSTMTRTSVSLLRASPSTSHTPSFNVFSLQTPMARLSQSANNPGQPQETPYFNLSIFPGEESCSSLANICLFHIVFMQYHTTFGCDLAPYVNLAYNDL